MLFLFLTKTVINSTLKMIYMQNLVLSDLKMLINENDAELSYISLQAKLSFFKRISAYFF